MAYRNYFRSVLNDNFKILTWILILFIAITPNFIFMQSVKAASLGGWQVGISGYQSGGKVGLEAVKDVMLNGQKHTKTSSTSLSVPAARIAKVLAGGGAAVALAEAVTALIGAGIDWVLDPANNQITYKEKTSINEPPYGKYTWSYPGYPQTSSPTATGACQVWATIIPKFYGNLPARFVRIESVNESANSAEAICVTFPEGYGSEHPVRIFGTIADPNAQDEEREKSIPLETVAQEVISQADAGSAAAARAVEAAAEDILNEASKDDAKARPITNALEANASTTTSETGTGTATKPNTANPEAPPEVADIALEFPVFCGWAPIVCEAAQVAISFPATIADYVAEFWAFVRSEPNSENGEVVIQDSNIIFDDSQRINFSSSCPVPEKFSVSFFGATQNLEFSYQPLCDFMSMIKPFVVAGSYLIGAYIVMGLSRGSAD